MCRLVLVMMTLAFAVGPTWALSSETDEQLPSEESTRYWVLRSQALNELIPFLTQKRSDLRDKYGYFNDFLEEIGKTQAFSATRIKVPESAKARLEIVGLLEDFEDREIQLPEKPVTWNEIVEIAMQFVMSEGFVPIDIADEAELQSFKNIMNRREDFCRKIRRDFKRTLDNCVKAWLFLGSINEQETFRSYVVKEKAAVKAAKAQARSDRASATRDERDSLRGDARRRRQQDSINLRHDRLLLKYRYRYNYYNY